MSQNSLVLATAGTLSGLAAVEAVNAALDTLNTLASGASAPASPEAGQFWHDTGNNLLKLRSQDNTAWIIVGTLDETNHVFSAATKAAPTIYGLAIANDTTTPATVIDVATGGAYDSTAAFYMRLATALRKTVSAAWAVGTGNGSLDTGSFQASKFYHVHLIYNATSGASDVITSLSYNSPALPAGYGYFAPIGAIFSNASSNVTAFTQTGNKFIYASGFQDINGISPPTSPMLEQLTVPQGLKVQALFRAAITSNDSAIFPAIVFQSPDEAAFTPASGGVQNSSLAAAPTSGNTQAASGHFALLTNTAGQIRIVSELGGGGPVNLFVYTYGFDYPRGLQ